MTVAKARKIDQQREALIHFRLFAEFEKRKDKTSLYNKVEPEYLISKKKKADLVLYKNDKPYLVIECKKYIKSKEIRSIDPFSYDVISQAMGYATELGAPYFATYNGDVGALFQTHQECVPLFERNFKAFSDINFRHDDFAVELVDYVIKAKEGKTQWATLDEQFIMRMASLHSLLVPHVINSLITHLTKENGYIKSVAEWFKRIGIDWENEDVECKLLPTFAVQASYVFIDKILFYKILEKNYPDLPNLTSTKGTEVFGIIESCFNSILDIDYEPIFHPDHLFARRDLFKGCEEEINDFIRDLSEVNLNRLDGDHLGMIYEKLIPPRIRHSLGQYYTPPEVCNLLTRWAIIKSTDTVLDPACGSGGFLSSAYDRLISINQKMSHREAIDRIHGIEINRFPAHLSAMNLTLKELKAHTNFINVNVKDYFNDSVRDTIGKIKINAIVGNPPYIRQELIFDKGMCRSHLPQSDQNGISNRSDIYVYFLTKSLRSLKEEGRLAFIASNRWLQTGYGDKFQLYLLANSNPIAFISFDKNVFKDALIGTVCMFLEAKNAKKPKNVNRSVKFIKIHQSMQQEQIIELIETKANGDSIIETNNYTIRNVSVKTLCESEESWRKYIYAPKIFDKIIKSRALIPLSQVAKVVRGKTTGSNNFFYLKDEDIEHYGLKKRYFKPLLKSVGQLESTDFGENDTEWRILDVDYLVPKAKIQSVISSTKKVKKGQIIDDKSVLNYLEKRGHSSLAKYIQIGASNGINKTPSLKTKSPWWSLGELPVPTFAFTKEVWKEFRTPILKNSVICDQHLYPIFPQEDLLPLQKKALGAILNSNLTWLMREVTGREASGQHMARNEVTVDEASKLLIPNIIKADAPQLKKFGNLLDDLIAFDRSEDHDRYVKARTGIDKICLELIGNPCTVDELQQAVSDCVERRMSAGHQTQGVMLSDSVPLSEKLNAINKNLKKKKPRVKKTRSKKSNL